MRFSDAEIVLYDPRALTMEDADVKDEQRHVSIGADALGRVPVVVLSTAGIPSGLYPRGPQPGKRGVRMKKEYDFSKAKRGAVLPQKGKTRITIYIDDDVLEAFRNRADDTGRGYQTLINDALRVHLGQASKVLDEDTLRKILREELEKID